MTKEEIEKNNAEFKKTMPTTYLATKLAVWMAMILALAGVGMLFWNYCAADILGLAAVSYRQSVVVMLLIRMLKAF